MPEKQSPPPTTNTPPRDPGKIPTDTVIRAPHDPGRIGIDIAIKTEKPRIRPDGR